MQAPSVVDTSAINRGGRLAYRQGLVYADLDVLDLEL